MKVLTWLLISLFGYGLSAAETYRTFEENGKTGLKDTEGHVIIPAAYDALGWSEGPFSVVDQVTGYKSSGRWGIIALSNKAVTAAEYTGLLPAEGNLILAYKRTGGASRFLAGCLDTSGKEVIPFQYDGLTINALRGIVYVKSGNQYKYGLIDLHNRTVIPIEYNQIQFLGGLRYAVQNANGKFALFSEGGKPLTGFIFDDISRFRNQYAIVYQDQYQGIIDRNGLLRINPSFTHIELEDDGSARGRRQNLWNILDGENEMLQQMQFDSVIALGSNLFGIRGGSTYSLVDSEFQQVSAEKFNLLEAFRDNRAIIRKDGKCGLISKTGKVLIAPQYRSLRQSGDRIVALLPNSQWVLLDTLGARLTAKTYDEIELFKGAYFTVRNQHYYGAVSTIGKEIISCVYDSIVEYSHDRLVVRFHGDYGIIDMHENWLTPPSPQRQYIIATDRYIQKKGNTWYLKAFDGTVIYFTDNPLTAGEKYLVETTSDGGVWKIGMDGRIVSRQMPPSEPFEEIFEETEGLRGIRKGGRFGFVDSQGRLRIANRYEGIKPFHEGLAAVRLLGKWGFVDHAERLVIQPVHDDVSAFRNGIAVVMQQGKYGLINKAGEVILPVRYETISPLASGRFELRNGNLTGLADRDGRLIFAPKFTTVTDLDNGYIIVGRDGKFGLVTLSGLSTVPMVYDHILYDAYGERYFALKQSNWEAIR